MDDIVLEAKKICKTFPGVKALKGVDFFMKKGEVHALVGENGAGKTTLVKILTRELTEDEGEVFLHKENISDMSIRQVQDLGLAIVSQVPNLVPMFSVGQNIMLGREPVRGIKVKWASLYDESEKLLSKITDRIDVKSKVSELSSAERQLVSIAKALSLEPSILILDEPTAPLGDQETQEFFNVLGKLKNEGISILYISHRLQEIFNLAEQVTVLRDGERIGTYQISEVNEEELVRLMIGQSLQAEIAKEKTTIGKERLRVEMLNVEKRNVRNISFAVRAGEILGIVGTMGAGKTEIISAMFGLEPAAGGKVFVDEKEIDLNEPKDAIRAGFALVPEERRESLVMDSAVAHNITIADLKRICKTLGWISQKKEKQIAEDFKNKLSIATPSVYQIAQFLSGGNQQKTVIARWLNADAKVYFFDEPTKGVDVGAKHEIYLLIGNLVENGAAVVYATNEIDEALGLCDRLVVLHRGQQAAELETKKTNRNELLLLMLGGKRNA